PAIGLVRESGYVQKRFHRKLLVTAQVKPIAPTMPISVISGRPKGSRSIAFCSQPRLSRPLTVPASMTKPSAPTMANFVKRLNSLWRRRSASRVPKIPPDEVGTGSGVSGVFWVVHSALSVNNGRRLRFRVTFQRAQYGQDAKQRPDMQVEVGNV